MDKICIKVIASLDKWDDEISDTGFVTLGGSPIAVTLSLINYEINWITLGISNILTGWEADLPESFWTLLETLIEGDCVFKLEMPLTSMARMEIWSE